ncbi:3-methyladenine DNA glycosylase AlkD [Nocardioides lianchengensis]|uniref:3-methyladenine DNA glycosylase AlkD n=1 Tax=Nocardioides lianchengensis TaxID=1045774 RepID=A0A1G7BWV1_9ACTN|nr:3-methyladenine DNA glycosylase AlkD [Nocardioides lianchengensis]
MASKHHQRAAVAALTGDLPPGPAIFTSVPADLALVEGVRHALAEAADPERAVGQQAYMKSVMPYRGVTLPALWKLLRPLLAEHPPGSRADWEATVRELWDHAAFREERYAATALVQHPAAKPWRDGEALPLARHLIVTGAWWDHVDELAVHLVGEALRADPDVVRPVLVAWATDDELWLRRTSVMCQVGAKGDVDVALLRLAIEANVDDRTFWLRKAIGWALRDHARADPDWVRAEVARLGDRLSGLSRREALKHLSPA